MVKELLLLPLWLLNARISADWKKKTCAGLRLIYDVRVSLTSSFFRLASDRREALVSLSRPCRIVELSTDYDLSIHRLSLARDGHFLPWKLNQQATLFLFWMTADGLTDGPNGKLPDSQFSLTIKW